MHFSVQHSFSDLTLPDYEKLYFDEAFNIALCQNVNLQRTLVSRDDQNGLLRRSVRVKAARELPAAIAKVLGSSSIEYTEHLEYRWGFYQGAWYTVSAILPEKIDTRGSFRFSQNGASVMRVLEGDVKVKIFGIGGLVEKGVVLDIERSYDDAAKFTTSWIRNHLHA